jgi:hypothetical protein
MGIGDVVAALLSAVLHAGWNAAAVPLLRLASS